jgi:hypothetical protein
VVQGCFDHIERKVIVQLKTFFEPIRVVTGPPQENRY